MKKALVTMVVALSAVSMIADAFARPVGGKRSFGRQSQTVRQMPRPAPAPAPAPLPPAQRQAAAPAPAAPAPAAPIAAGATASRAGALQQRRPSVWKNVLGGALLGLGLGALLSHFGIGGALASVLSTILMLALLALAMLFIVRMFRRKDTPANPAFQGYGAQPVPAGATPEIGANLRGADLGQGPQSFGTGHAGSGVSLDKSAAAPHLPWGVPAGFDTEAFLRHAKSAFIRMQAAWDRGDVADLREFTTPEVFAELKLQLGERGAEADFTDVVTIDARLLGIEEGPDDYLASVQFNGMIRSAPSAPAEPFAEVWNMEKPRSDDGGAVGGWVLAGIQQIA